MSYQNYYNTFNVNRTYEMHPYSNISRLNYSSYQNLIPNNQSLPFQSEFTKKQYNNPSPIDLSTSLSNSDHNNSNNKLYGSKSFENELKNKYNEINNNNCNCDCHKRIINPCNSFSNLNNNNNVNLNQLLNELSDLRCRNKQLIDEVNRNKNDKNFSDNYIKELEKENLRNHNSNNNNLNDDNSKLKKDKGRYIEMLDQVFSNILNPISNSINSPDGKLKGGVDNYFNRNLEFQNILNEQKKYLDDLMKNKNPFNENLNNMNSMNSIDNNPYYNSNAYLNNSSKDFNPRNNYMMGPNKTYEINRDNISGNNNKNYPLNKYRNDNINKKPLNKNSFYDSNKNLSSNISPEKYNRYNNLSGNLSPDDYNQYNKKRTNLNPNDNKPYNNN